MKTAYKIGYRIGWWLGYHALEVVPAVAVVLLLAYRVSW